MKRKRSRETRGTARSSVIAAVPATESLRVTSTLSRPSVSSVHAIALQRTIGIGIYATLTLAEAAAALSPSTGADMALHRTIIIVADCV